MKHSAFAKRDSNHDELVKVCRELHCGVIDTHAMGYGFPDVLLHFSGWCGPVEIKTEAGELEPSQVRFIRDWKGPTIEIVRTQDEMVAFVQRVRARQARV